MAKTSSLQTATLWFFTIVFLLFGVLNAIQVHIIPGLFYIVLALLYLPYIGIALRGKIGLSIPFIAKVIFGLWILWASLAVGDLAELYGL